MSESVTPFTPPDEFVDLDTQGLNCPEPVMLLHAEVRKAGPGDVIRVLASDPSTQRDIPRFCQYLGHELLRAQGDDGLYTYWIRTAAS
ncbi:MAG: sulfurtransferase TusA [Natronospirillum sp.]|uniref:sulfurtransferase TusA n=1 Tax=Natronospirillum sp. TaxID=2812955 RepID=UPI0025F2E96C|nr:sulfurtransferase TusA [Natronospirillum sp.]MCH8550826.1 sulfurtransferase TusA [Natronospirillum sp.]